MGSTGDQELDAQIARLLKRTGSMLHESLSVLPGQTVGLTVALLASTRPPVRAKVRSDALACAGIAEAEAFDALFAAADVLEASVQRRLAHRGGGGGT